MGKSGKWTLQPITTLLYEDYPYSVNVTAQTKHHHIVEISLYKDVSIFIAQAYCGSISSKRGCIHIFGPDWYLLGLAECGCIHIVSPDWYLLGLAECGYISIYGCIHIFGQGEKISNDQEVIQSDPTSSPQNQKGNK